MSQPRTNKVSALKITGLRARGLLCPLPRPISTAKTVIPNAPLVLIDVETDQGLIGSAYIFTYTPLMIAPVLSILKELETPLKQLSTDPVSTYRAFETQFRLLGRQGLLGMALSGVDMALWDLRGKQMGVPVCSLLGASPTAIPAYDSHGFIDVARDEDLLTRSLDQGFKAIKIKVGAPDLRDDIETVRNVRDLIGPDIRLMIDFNQSLSAAEARYRLSHLQEFDLYWAEEPVPSEDHIGHAAVRNHSEVPIQTGENWWFAQDVTNALTARGSDHAMLDIMKIGGVTGWMEAAAVANAGALPVSSHLFIEASAHVLAATARISLLEYLDLAGPILQAPYAVENGTVTARGPGLGMAWDESAIVKLT